jgi:HEAT repeat protein
MSRKSGLLLPTVLVGLMASAQNVLTPAQEDQLMQALNNPEMKVRLQAALILGNAGNARAVPALVGCTGDEDYRVRGACSLALGRLNDLRGVEPLVRLLDDREQFVREEAVRSLKLLARPEAVSYLRAGREQLTARGRELLVDISNSIAEGAAADSLLVDQMGEEAPNVRAAVDAALSRLDLRRAQALASAGLAHSNYRVRARAATLMGDLGIADIERLGAVLANPAELPEVHASVRAALRKVATAIKAEGLETTAKDSSLSDSQRAEALMLLAAKGGDRSYQVCVAALSDTNEFIRGTAATALADLGDVRAIEHLRAAAVAPKNARIARLFQGSIRQLESGPRAP